MSSTKYANLEKSVKFKSRFVPKSTWKKNFIYLLAPIILLLFSIFSLIYIYEAGRLISWLTVPYGVAFVFSVIFLKLSKNYVVKKEVTQEGRYLICLGKIVKEEDKGIYAVFTNGVRRQDKSFIERIFKQVVPENIPSLGINDEAQILVNEEEETLYVKKFRKSDLPDRNIKYAENDILLLLYVDTKHVSLLTEKKAKI